MNPAGSVTALRFLPGKRRALRECLESRLKRIAAVEWFDTYRQLEEEAQQRRGLHPYCGVRAECVFERRDEVVHKGWEPGHDTAAEVLAKAGGLLAELPKE